MNKHILVVDDEARIREVVQYALEREGYQITTLHEGSRVVERVASGGIDLIVLDIMLPTLDGLEICRRLRRSSAVPILFLSAKAEEIDRVVGLELGGDDYLSKPFSPRELVARVRAILRRSAAGGDGPVEPEASAPSPSRGAISVGALLIDLERHQVRYEDHPIVVTATELGLLAALYERPGVVLSRGQLMRRAYAYDNLITERTIDTHVRRIRAKFRRFEIDPIATVYGVGYRASEL